MHLDLSLISLNIEGREHLERFVPFITQAAPDVVCLQELCRQDIAYLEQAFQMTSYFAPMNISSRYDDEIGVGIFTSLPARVQTHRYAGHAGTLVKSDPTSPETRYSTQQYVLLMAEVTGSGQVFTIGTTHFPVTAEGAATDFQRDALAGLLAALGEYDEMVLCGDFNAPRGREIFDTIAAKYIDNIPAEYTSSIDGDMHRAGPIPFMVDGLFTTPAYTASQVTLTSGVSDHCAISATISRK